MKLLDTILRRKSETTEDVAYTHQGKEAIRYREELKRQNNFFKRKKVNPHTLYNTLVFITPCFDHREDDWEEFLQTQEGESTYTI
jgi:hypothetical protein